MALMGQSRPSQLALKSGNVRFARRATFLTPVRSLQLVRLARGLLQLLFAAVIHKLAVEHRVPMHNGRH